MIIDTQFFRMFVLATLLVIAGLVGRIEFLLSGQIWTLISSTGMILSALGFAIIGIHEMVRTDTDRDVEDVA